MLFFHLTLLLSLYFLKTCIPDVQTVQNTSVFVVLGKKDFFNVRKSFKKMRKKAIEGTKTRRTLLLNILY